MSYSVLIDKEKCTGCGICAKVCPVNVFDVIDKKSTAARGPKCMGCELCEVECPEAAIAVERIQSKAVSPWETKSAPDSQTPGPPQSADLAPPVAEATTDISSSVSGMTQERPEQEAAKPAPVIRSTSFPTSRRVEEVDEEATAPEISPPPTRRVETTEERQTQVADERKPSQSSSPDTLTWEYPSFTKAPVATGAEAVAPKLGAPETAGDAPPSSTKVLTVFPELCVNCRICELVCSLQHTGEFNPFKTCVKITYKGNSGPYTPTICRHCRKAACEAACPTGALYYEGKVVLLEREKCIRCLECVRACPFAAVQVGPAGEIYKCDLCGGEPACAKYCPPRPENTAGRLAHPKASAIQYVEPHNVSAMRRLGLAASKK
jgi:Fe-S-cluster-containing hydrogenase component 2